MPISGSIVSVKEQEIRFFTSMSEIDKRGKLEAEPFSFRTTKDRKVFIYWNGKQVLVLKGIAAKKFLASISSADAQQAQLVMARVTGHFKHGTEN